MAAPIQELFVVLEQTPNTKWTVHSHTNGAGYFFGVFIGKEGAEKLCADLNIKRDTFKVFALNSAEAFEAIHHQPAVDFSAGTIPVERTRFELAAEPLMRYMANTHHPHTTAIVDSTKAQLFEGMISHNTDKFLVD